MSVTTKRGDDGETGLRGGRKAAKSEHVVTVLGDLDELNSHIGLVLSTADGLTDYELLLETQHALFEIGSWVASEEYTLPEEHLEELISTIEEIIVQHEEDTPKLDSFILPGGTVTSAQLHIARVVARRAERSLIRYNQERSVPAVAKKLLNRISDWLFMAARRVNCIAQRDEIVWKRKETS